MNADEIRGRALLWIDVCRRHLESCDQLPYVDDLGLMTLVDELPLSSGAELSNFELLALEFEKQLALDPLNDDVRFAALACFSRGARGYIPYNLQTHLDSLFQRLTSYCVPEALTDIVRLRFELYNCYLANNWELARKILRRIALLDILPPAQLHLTRGHFWFLSVFGRRIMSELRQDEDYQYECFWQSSIPGLWMDLTESERVKTKRELLSFAHPELLEYGSLRHLVLTAWSLNPRVPKPICVPPEALGDDDLVAQQNTSSDIDYGRAIFRRRIHDQARDFEAVSPPSLRDESRERLTAAVHSIKEGMACDAELATAYHPLLARGLFALGQLQDAKSIFNSILQGEDDYRWEVTFYIALCNRLAGEHDAAIKTLLEFHDHPPKMATGVDPHPVQAALDRPGLLWWAAKWLAERGEYDMAATYLRKELESEFSPPESWQLSAIIALGEIDKRGDENFEQYRRLLSQNPTFRRILEGAISELWPTFAYLNDDAKVAWLYATQLCHTESPLVDLQFEQIRGAIRQYGKALEIELTERFFVPFRKAITSDQQLLRRTKQDDMVDSKMRRYVAGTGSLTLGDMISAIERAMNSVVESDILLKKCLTFSSIETIRVMKQIRDARNSATHSSSPASQRQANECASRCRLVLDTFVEMKRDGTSAPTI